MEWTVNELAQRAGISGRALRHYHQIGLLNPDRVGSNGYRYYGTASVARLQRILLLRDTGMPLMDIKAVLEAPAAPDAEVEALAAHLKQLAQERMTLDRRIHSVEHTLTMRRQGREPRMDVMLEGFNDRYESEVVERWGQVAFDVSNQWWHSKSLQQQKEWKTRAEALLARWREIQEEEHELDSSVAQHHASVHVQWFKEIPGTPTHAGNPAKSVEMIHGLADQYESNPDFHLAFGTERAARFAAKALRLHTTSAPGLQECRGRDPR